MINLGLSFGLEFVVISGRADICVDGTEVSTDFFCPSLNCLYIIKHNLLQKIIVNAEIVEFNNIVIGRFENWIIGVGSLTFLHDKISYLQIK